MPLVCTRWLTVMKSGARLDASGYGRSKMFGDGMYDYRVYECKECGKLVTMSPTTVWGECSCGNKTHRLVRYLPGVLVVYQEERARRRRR